MTNLFRSRTTRLALPIVGLLLFYACATFYQAVMCAYTRSR